MKKLRAVILAGIVAGVLVTTHMQPAHAAAAVRSGTIIGGFFPFAAGASPGPPAECSWNVDCLAWLQSDCNPAIVGVDPGLHSSIVDVGKLAGSRKKRELRVFPKQPGIMWGAVAVQFWARDCTELALYRSSSHPLSGFKIPRTAAWMTVASMDTTSFAWELQ